MSGEVKTLAGSGSSGAVDGVGTAASFYGPVGVCVDPSTGSIFVCDYGNEAIRKITQNGLFPFF